MPSESQYHSRGKPRMSPFGPSCNRPGGNAIGMDILTDALEVKRLGLLHQLVRNETTVGFLWNPLFASAGSQQRDVQDAARDHS
jgi:hypothetical protein